MTVEFLTVYEGAQVDEHAMYKVATHGFSVSREKARQIAEAAGAGHNVSVDPRPAVRIGDKVYLLSNRGQPVDIQV